MDPTILFVTAYILAGISISMLAVFHRDAWMEARFLYDEYYLSNISQRERFSVAWDFWLKAISMSFWTSRFSLHKKYLHMSTLLSILGILFALSDISVLMDAKSLQILFSVDMFLWIIPAIVHWKNKSLYLLFPFHSSLKFYPMIMR